MISHPHPPVANIDDFLSVHLALGTVIGAEHFSEARNPAYKVTVDFGPHGTKRTSAQITHHYQPEDLIGKRVIGVINLPSRQIGPMMSEFLLTGFSDDQGGIILASVDMQGAPDGARLH